MTGSQPPAATLILTIRRLAGLAWHGHRRLLVMALATTVVLAVAELIFLYALMVLLHRVTARAGTDVWFLLFAVAGLAVALSALRIAALRTQEALGLMATNDIANAIFGAAVHRSIGDHRRRRAEEIGVALEDARMIGNTAVVPLLNAGGALVVIVALAAAIVAINWRIVAIVGPTISIAYWAVVSRNRHALHRAGVALAAARRHRARIVDEAQANFRHLLEVGAEAVVRRAFADSAATIARLQLRHRLLGAVPRAVLEPLLMAAGLATVVLMLREPGGGDESIPALAALATALLRLLQATNLMTASIAQVQGNLPVLGHLLRLEMIATQRDHVIPVPVTFARDIQLRNVTVCYDRGDAASDRALDGVVLTIAKGEKLAIVGRSGSGKSTLLDVLLGLIVPDAGAVLVDGVDIAGEAGRIAGWRQQIATVAQDLYVSDLAIDQLIAGAEPVDDARLRRCLADAGLAEWVDRLPRGAATRLGPSGLLVSGGQRQRLGIARALYRDAAVIVLDEATAQLDFATEAALLKRLLEPRAERTVIIVTHREQNLAGFDRLVRLEQGQIVQDLQLPGWHARAVRDGPDE